MQSNFTHFKCETNAFFKVWVFFAQTLLQILVTVKSRMKVVANTSWITGRERPPVLF